MICGRSCTIKSIAICPLDALTISSKQDVFTRMWFSMLLRIFSSSSAIRSRIFRRSMTRLLSFPVYTNSKHSFVVAAVLFAQGGVTLRST